MSRAVRWFTTARVRRVVQVLLLSVFFALVLLTRFQATSVVTSAGRQDRIARRIAGAGSAFKVIFHYRSADNGRYGPGLAQRAENRPLVAADNRGDDALGPGILRLDLPDGNDPRHCQPIIPPPQKPQRSGQLVAMAIGQVLSSGGLAGRSDFRHCTGSACSIPLSGSRGPRAPPLVPATQWAAKEGSTTIYQSDPGIGPVRLEKVVEPSLSIHQQVRIRAGRRRTRSGLSRRRVDPRYFLSLWWR